MRVLSKVLPVSIIFLSFTAQACDVRLARPTPSCPAVTYGPEDCDTTLTGKRGDLFRPTIVHIMSNGRSYACASHESCVEMKDLDFKGCKFRFQARFREESPEYVSHLLIE